MSRKSIEFEQRNLPPKSPEENSPKILKKKIQFFFLIDFSGKLSNATNLSDQFAKKPDKFGQIGTLGSPDFSEKRNCLRDFFSASRP